MTYSLYESNLQPVQSCATLFSNLLLYTLAKLDTKLVYIAARPALATHPIVLPSLFLVSLVHHILSHGICEAHRLADFDGRSISERCIVVCRQDWM